MDIGTDYENVRYQDHLDENTPSFILEKAKKPFTGHLSQEEQSLESEISRVRSEYANTYRAMKDVGLFIGNMTDIAIKQYAADDELWEEDTPTRNVFDSDCKERFILYNISSFPSDGIVTKEIVFDIRQELIQRYHELAVKLIDYHHAFHKLIVERIRLLEKREQNI